MKQAVEPFRAIEISALARRLSSEGRSVLHMEFGQPSTGAPAAAIDAARRALDSDRMGYWESAADRKSVGSGKSVSVRVDLGGRRVIKTKQQQEAKNGNGIP